ncbi:LuxR C-terminal-related transcriptional regulator [Streptomyces sp. WM6372]|uniref:LuxR C-terminal-related transcriptional regulator n=1 Tax=Streptomyces sp. WM6372 TaxID=1415555 RepID=UPI0006AF9802|nr:response regulator transcription factor [Streptomyces sp. WM6372]
MSRVLIVESHDRSGLRPVVEAVDAMVVVGEAADAVQAVKAAKEYQPDVVIMDVCFPGQGAVDATRQLLGLGFPPRVLAVTTASPDGRVLDVLRAGASGFVVQDCGPDELAHAVRTVAAGGNVLDSKIMQTLTRERHSAGSHDLRERIGNLTDTERQMLALIGGGHNNQRIADGCHLSITTVKTHVSRLLQRLGLEHRIQAAVLAWEAGIVGRD